MFTTEPLKSRREFSYQEELEKEVARLAPPSKTFLLLLISMA